MCELAGRWMLLGERVDTLMAERKAVSARLEDHERRLIRIETLIEFSRTRRSELPKGSPP